MTKTDASIEPTAPKLDSSRRLVRASWRDLRANFWLYIGIIAVITVPVDLLMLNTSLSTDGGFSAYTTVAAVFMNTALIFAAYGWVARGERPKFGTSYYQGTAGILRLLLVNAALLVILIPMLFGYIIFSYGSASAEGITVSAGEQALLGLIWLLFSIPTIWLLTRFIFAIYAVVGEDLRPMAALKLSRNLTLGRFWRVLGRLMFLVLVLIIAGVIAAAPLFVLSLVFHSATVLSLVFQLLASLLALPFIHLYMSRLFTSLKTTAKA